MTPLNFYLTNRRNDQRKSLYFDPASFQRGKDFGKPMEMEIVVEASA